MDRPVELIALKCFKCDTPVPAGSEEVAWVCKQCGQGLALDEKKGLVPLKIQFQAGLSPQSVGKPFWVAEGQAYIQRETYSGSGQTAEAALFWSLPRTFYVPAFPCTMDILIALGVRLLLQPPALQPGSQAAFESITLAQADLEAAAEFIVVAIEADRKDKLKKVQVSVKLSEPVLWILP